MTQAQRLRLLEQQGGVCAICGRSDSGSKRGWHVDHDHEASERAGRIVVRAILCHHCNTGLGLFGDSPARLRAAAVYIEQHRVAHASVGIFGQTARVA